MKNKEAIKNFKKPLITKTKFTTARYVWENPRLVDYHIAWIHEDELVGTSDRKLYIDHDKCVSEQAFLMYRDFMKLAGFHHHYYWAQNSNPYPDWEDIGKHFTHKVTYKWDGKKAKRTNNNKRK